MQWFLVAALLCAIGHCAYGADTDDDGLLDVIDVAGFNANASGDVEFDGRGIQDVDGANLLTKATTLHLTFNQITSLENGDFQGLSNLGGLRLIGNQITSLESGDFEGLSNLQVVELWGNQITTIESGAFQGLSDLKTLNLSDNQITGLESGDFQGLSNLQLLVLYGNQITSLESGAFQELSNLHILALHFNQITSLENGAFSGLNNLATLILTGNPIMELNLTGATFDSLAAGDGFGGGFKADEFTELILDDAVLSLGSFEAIVLEAGLITNVSIVGLGFSDMSPDDLSNLLSLERLDNVRVDQALFDRYAAAFNAFDTIPANTVTVVPEPSAIFLCTAAWILGWAFRQRHDQPPMETEIVST